MTITISLRCWSLFVALCLMQLVCMTTSQGLYNLGLYIPNRPETSNQFLKVPLQFSITFTLEADLLPTDELLVTLPYLSKVAVTNNPEDDHIAYGGVAITPSTDFTAAWYESSVVVDGYARTTGYLKLQTRYGVTVPVRTAVNITVMESNRIGAQCGFPSSAVLLDNSTFKANFNPLSIYQTSTKSYYYFTNSNGVGLGCTQLDNCNKHGACDYCTQVCYCDEGYGATPTNENVQYGSDLGISCKSRVCPIGKAFTELPLLNVAHQRYVECSNVGVCDRVSGDCRCPAPYTGKACERMACPNDCSGHGQCVSMKEFSRLVASDVHHFEYGTTRTATSTTWDADMIFGCLCDSSWKVGYDRRETQLSEYFGPDCSLRRCPSGDDPFTPNDEENCHLKTQPGAPGGFRGLVNSRCHVDCSNRGICDYHTGKCSCFDGSWGDNCGLIANQGTKQN